MNFLAKSLNLCNALLLGITVVFKGTSLHAGEKKELLTKAMGTNQQTPFDLTLSSMVHWAKEKKLTSVLERLQSAVDRFRIELRAVKKDKKNEHSWGVVLKDMVLMQSVDSRLQHILKNLEEELETFETAIWDHAYQNIQKTINSEIQEKQVYGDIIEKTKAVWKNHGWNLNSKQENYIRGLEALSLKLSQAEDSMQKKEIWENEGKRAIKKGKTLFDIDQLNALTYEVNPSDFVQQTVSQLDYKTEMRKMGFAVTHHAPHLKIMDEVDFEIKSGDYDDAVQTLGDFLQEIGRYLALNR